MLKVKDIDNEGGDRRNEFVHRAHTLLQFVFRSGSVVLMAVFSDQYLCLLQILAWPTCSVL
jgi:hypothetical protein